MQNLNDTQQQHQQNTPLVPSIHLSLYKGAFATVLNPDVLAFSSVPFLYLVFHNKYYSTSIKQRNH